MLREEDDYEGVWELSALKVTDKKGGTWGWRGKWIVGKLVILAFV